MADTDIDLEVTTNNSPCLVGGASVTREHDPHPAPDVDESRWLCAMRRTGTTVTLLDYTPEPVAAVLKSKHWARLVKGMGWTFPLDYLEHVERLLDGAGVDLFDVDGGLTPAQRRRARATQHAASRQVFAELRAARDAAEADPTATDQARMECQRAYAEAIAARHPDAEENR